MSDIRFIAYAVLLSFPLGYMKGCMDEAKRFESFRAGVEVIGKEAERAASERAAAQKRLAKEVENANAAALGTLADRYSRLLAASEARARRSPVPPAPATADGTEAKICYSQDDLSRGLAEALRKLRAGTYGILRKGDEALIDRASWGDWAGGLTPPGQ